MIGTTGPFTDALGKPLVAKGQFRACPIDPSVFVDANGSPHLHFGNGTCFVVRLGPELVSLSGNPLDTPPPGFREAANLFARNGVHYLMWSENDTRDATCQVSWVRARSPLGPFTKAAGNPVLKRNPSADILATGGSRCVFQRPGADEWYIAYHRFKVPGGDGYHREVCIDRHFFNADGSIKPVVPTR